MTRALLKRGLSPGITVLAFILLFVSKVHADVIYLYDGNILIVDKAWVEGDEVKYQTSRGVCEGYRRRVFAGFRQKNLSMFRTRRSGPWARSLEFHRQMPEAILRLHQRCQPNPAKRCRAFVKTCAAIPPTQEQRPS